MEKAKDRKGVAISIVSAMPKPGSEDVESSARADAMKQLASAFGVELDDAKAAKAAEAFALAYDLCCDSEKTESESGEEKSAY